MIKIGSFAIALLGFASLSTAAQHGVIPEDINRNGAACTDFFDYANGAWRKANAIPDYMDRWSRRWKSGELNKEHVRDILAGLSGQKTWPSGSPEQLSGDFYAACMDEGRINKLGITPLQPLLAEVRAIKTEADLQRVIAHLHDMRIFAPFAVYSQSELHNPTQVSAQVDAAGLGLPDRDYYLKTEPRFVEARQKYRDHVTQMFILAGSTPSAAKAAAATVFDFEKRLAEASLDNVALRDPAQQDHKMTFAGLTALAPDFNWGAYFDAAKLPRADLNVAQPMFLQRVDREMAATPLSQWRSYLEWQVLHSAANSLSAPFVEQNFAFYGKYLSGATEMKPRWKRCAEATDSQLGEALGRAYVDKYFTPADKARMQEMVKNILLAMHDTITGLDWMSAQTKAKAMEKLATFNPKIGYPDKWKNYQGLAIERNAYWRDVVAASRWNVADDRALIGKAVDRGRWGMTPPTSDAYYNPQLNEIVFPAGILQPPAFDASATDAVNYGAIGVVIGHEISHGFDDEGAQFDAQGRLNNWWTPEDHKKFEDRGQCVVKQFDGYFIEPGIHHNGKLVLGESIGDLGGLRLAYLAYKKSREGKGPEPTIDGFTPEQQFFLAWGQWRGDETRAETQRTMVQGDPHPIAKYRVNGPLSNLPAFREAFACKADAPMVRSAAQRCEVW
jgi:endothelin-converting enzyme/putative endopeptidase